MNREEVRAIVAELRTSKIQPPWIECRVDVGEIYPTLSSFSNHRSGGTFVFGIDETKGFDLVGVEEVENLKERLLEQCEQMIPVVRPLLTEAEVDSKRILAAEIPGVFSPDGPAHYAGKGIHSGSFVRKDGVDVPMSEAEIRSYRAYFNRIEDDLRTVETPIDIHLDEERLSDYLGVVKNARGGTWESLSDEDVLEATGVYRGGRLTLAGALVFSKIPRLYYEGFSVKVARVPGYQIGDSTPGGKLFVAKAEYDGGFEDIIKKCLRFVDTHTSTGVFFPGDSATRVDVPEYPHEAIREALMNALVHRDYSAYVSNTPVFLTIFSDRIEISNPGSLFGFSSLETLGQGKPETRNPTLSRILETMDLIDNRGTGIAKIRAAMEKRRLPGPIFKNENGEFTIVLRNGAERIEPPLSADGKKDPLWKAILQFCRVPRTRAEIVEFTGLSRVALTMYHLQPMLSKQLLALTIPDKPKSKFQRYYRAKKLGNN